MSDEPPRPGVRPLTWVTLGLLAVPGWGIGLLLIQVLPPVDLPLMVLSVVVWVVVAAPFLLLAAATWVGRTLAWQSSLTFPPAVLYTGLTAAVVAEGWLGAGPNEFVWRAVSLGWLAGYPVGFALLYVATAVRERSG